MWPEGNPYTSIFIICIFLGSLLGFLYWKFIEKQRGVDSWSSNLISTMMFGATMLTIVVILIIHNPIFPITLRNKNEHLITIAAFQAKRVLPNTIILDLRTPAEFAKFHFPQAICLDFYEKNLQEKVDNLEKFKIYLLQCSHNAICGRMQKILAHQGFHHVFYAPDLRIEGKR